MRNLSLRLAPAVLALACAPGGAVQTAPVSPAPPPGPAAAAPQSPPAPPPAPARLPPPDAESVGLIQQQLAAALRYPAAARAAAEQGRPVVGFDFDRGGRILGVRLMQDSGSEALDAEALDVFKRIGAFHLAVPAAQAPGQDRFSLALPINFRLWYESQRDPAAPPDAPAGEVRPLTAPLAPAWRSDLAAAIAAAWQRPQPAPGQYRVVLHLLLGPDGQPLEASLRQGSGDAALDASLLDAARRAHLPPPYDASLFAREIQLCLAAPDEACAPRDSLRTTGTALLVSAYVADGTPIVSRVGRFSTYLQQLNRTISANVRYPPDSLKRQEEGNLIVRVHMLRDGTITEVRFLQLTRFDALNAEARNVFDRIARFPPVPEGVLPDMQQFEFQLPLSFELH